MNFVKFFTLRSFTHTNTLLRRFHLDTQLNATYQRSKREPKNFDKKSSKKLAVVQRQMSVRQLADSMEKPIGHVNSCLEHVKNGQFYVSNHGNKIITDYNIILEVLKLSGYRAQMKNESNVEKEMQQEMKYLDENDEYIEKRAPPKSNDLVRRSPIVTIMGHVDHGKTTLLDALRNTNVVESEFGGITQHISAFNCKLADVNIGERTITFLDTPGHAAFISMRECGAKLTDIVVLVIAADDGVMAQTVESINIAKQSGCPIIVAINKIDKATKQQIDKTKRDLIEYELQPEDLGGSTQVVGISALKRQNLELLKEEIWAQAEILELKGDPKGLVEGFVIESRQEEHRGKITNAIVKRGTLKKGSYLVCGTSYCRVKQLFDHQMNIVNQASLAQAVQIMGWKESLPRAGDAILEVNSEQRAKEIVEIRLKKEALKKDEINMDEIQKKRQKHHELYRKSLESKRKAGHSRGTINYDVYNKEAKDIFGENDENLIKTLSILVKTDVAGTLEAIKNILDTYDEFDKVKLDIISIEVGPVTQNDLELASLFNATIYCFNLDTNKKLIDSKQEYQNVRLKSFNIIYRLFDDLIQELEKLTPYVEQEKIVGQAEVVQIFDYSEKKTTFKVIGGRCKDGYLDSKLFFKLIRNDTVVTLDKEKCKSLKHFKQEVPSVKKGTEFGFIFDSASIQAEKGDSLVCYEIVQVQDKIEWDLGF